MAETVWRNSLIFFKYWSAFQIPIVTLFKLMLQIENWKPVPKPSHQCLMFLLWSRGILLCEEKRQWPRSTCHTQEWSLYHLKHRKWGFQRNISLKSILHVPLGRQKNPYNSFCLFYCRIRQNSIKMLSRLTYFSILFKSYLSHKSLKRTMLEWFASIKFKVYY